MANKNFVVHNGLTVGSLTVDAATGDVTTSGNLTVTGNVAVSAIQNGNSNVRVAANGNVTISATGAANIVTFAVDQTTIDSNLKVNITAGIGPNINQNDFLSMGQALVVGDTGKNSGITIVTQPNGEGFIFFADGNTGNARGEGFISYNHTNTTMNLGVDAVITTLVLGNGSANVTGTLGVSGNITAGNLVATGDIRVNGNDIRSSTGNVAITLNNTDVTIVGNLAVQGTTSTIGSENYSVQDSIIDLHTFPNLAPLTSDDGRDIGIRMHYFKSVDDKHAFVGWANDTGFLEYYSDATETNGVVSGTYGTIKAANIFSTDGYFYNGNSSVRVQANSNVTINVTAANSYTFATGSFAPNGNGAQQLGLTGARWSNIWGLASSAQYADLAERYDAGIYIEPGTVVEFGGDNEVQICGTQMSTKVAGVVSTAPGYLMNDTAEKGDNWVPVALQGRVPTKVVGPVAKGDMMVSAGNGHAMSCAAPVVGSVIGKALENFEGEEGVIEVVVGRL